MRNRLQNFLGALKTQNWKKEYTVFKWIKFLWPKKKVDGDKWKFNKHIKIGD
jgi:hypothetical protein